MATKEQTRIMTNIRALGLSCTFSKEWGNEYRVTAPIAAIQRHFPTLSRAQAIGKAEAIAVYTDCPYEATNAAKVLAEIWGN